MYVDKSIYLGNFTFKHQGYRTLMIDFHPEIIGISLSLLNQKVCTKTKAQIDLIQPDKSFPFPSSKMYTVSFILLYLEVTAII